MSPSERGDLDFNVILDRIIELTEKNLDTQKEFTAKLYELKNRFDSSDRDHKDITSDSKYILDGIDKIYDKMKATPNEQLLDAINELRATSSNIHGEVKDINSTRQLCESYHKRNSEVEHKIDMMAESVKGMSDSYTIIKNILGGMSIVLIVLQILIGVYFTVARHSDVKTVVDTVIKELHEQDTKLEGDKGK